MRITYLVTRMDSLGGAQVHVRDMALAMQKKGNEVFVLGGGEGPFSLELKKAGIHYQSVGRLGRSVNPWNDIQALSAIIKALKINRPDLLSLHSSKAGWLGRIAGWLLGIPTIFTAHGWSFSCGLPAVKATIYRSLEKIMAPFSSCLITVSQSDRQLALACGLIKEEKVTAVHNGVPDIPAECLGDPAVQPPHLIMVARFQEPKDHKKLLRVLAEIDLNGWTLEFVGEGPKLEETICFAKNLGLEQKVCFSGACTDISRRLGSAQLFILLSNREGLPRSILEAMRAGLPVVASDVGGVREAVENGRTGILIPPDDNEGAFLREHLVKLMQSPHLRKKMGDAGREVYLQKFTFTAMFDRTFSIYLQVIEIDRERRDRLCAAISQ